MASISLCMIVRDVETIIRQCLQSVVPHVDEIVIVDTGSTDGTKNAVLGAAPNAKILDFTHKTNPEAFLVDEGATWSERLQGHFTGKHFLANFGAARQLGWQRASGDYLMWLDSDDLLAGGENLTGIVDDMARNKIDTAMLNYDYAFDSKGNPTCKLTRERIVRRGLGSRWVQPVHEVVLPCGTPRFYAQVNVVHRRAEYKLQPSVANRNLKILLGWFQKHRKDPDLDPRMLFYLAMEERFVWPEKAIADFKTYCNKSGWDEERCSARLIAGFLCEQRSRYDEAFAEYAQAHVDFPPNPEPLFGCARIAYFKKDWQKVIEHTERGLKIVEEKSGRPSVMMHDPLDRSYRPHVFYSAALVNTGQFKRALESCEAGLKWNPEDPYLKGNKETALRNLDAVKAPMPNGSVLNLKIKRDEPLDAPSMDLPADLLTAFALQLWKKGMEAKDPPTALKMLESLPPEISRTSRIEEARKMTLAKIEADNVPSPAAEERVLWV